MDTNFAQFVYFALVMLSSHADAFRWKTEGVLYVTGCVGSEVTVPWSYLTNKTEMIKDIQWFRGDHLSVASLRQNSFTSLDRRLKKSNDYNAGFTFDPAAISDNGYYQVKVKFQGQEKDEIVSSAFVMIAEPAQLINDSAHVTKVTFFNHWRVILSRGHFEGRGYPPVEVIWRDPAGQEFPSSRFQDGVFYLDLPQNQLPGIYTSYVAMDTAMRCCLTDSRLLRKVEVYVPGADGEDEEEEEDEEDEGYGNGLGDEGSIEELQGNLRILQDSMRVLQAKWGESTQNAVVQKSQIEEALKRQSFFLALLNTRFDGMEARQKDGDTDFKIFTEAVNDRLQKEFENIGKHNVQLSEKIDNLEKIVDSSSKALADYCPTGWVQFHQSCYLFNHVESTFDSAQDFCSKRSSRLVRIDNALENNFVGCLNEGGFNFWIGLHDEDKKDEWTWVLKDDDGNSKTSYTNWASTQPQKGNGEHCAVMRNWSWHDYTCTRTFRSVCETDGRGIFLQLEGKTTGVDGNGLTNRCPTGWVHFQQSCYLLNYLESTFASAKDFCEKRSSKLVRIDSVAENNFVRSLEQGRLHLWIGLHDEDKDNGWTWIINDDNGNNKPSFTHWGSDQPEPGKGEHCGTMLYPEWHDYPCTLKFRSVCETDVRGMFQKLDGMIAGVDKNGLKSAIEKLNKDVRRM